MLKFLIINLIRYITLVFLLANQNLVAVENNPVIFPDTTVFELEPIIVTASRFPVRQQDAVYAVTPIDKISLQTARRQLSLRESLVSVPGLMALNENNFSQDLRLSIRGFGARAAFGIRGIKVLIDGVPVTTPDGQTQLDNLNMGIIDRIEVVRGPTSALYGNASGGVIHLSSQKPPKSLLVETKLASGSYGFRNLQLSSGQDFGKTNALISAVYNGISGYRDQSAMKTYLLNGIVQFKPDSISDLTIRLSLENSPLAEDPGSLTQEQVKENPTQANPNNLMFNSGEEVFQGRAGLFYEREFNHFQKLKANAYFTKRQLDNRLPFEEQGIVDLGRNYGGFNILYLHSGSMVGYPLQLASGVEFAHQRDDRKRYDNLNGDRGGLVFNQDEQYTNSALFVQMQTDLSQKWHLNLGLRYDIVHVKVQNLLNENGVDSGMRTLRGLSGMIGSLFQIAEFHNLYGNISSGFETPALIELTNNPEGDSGLNQNLNAQQAINYELGMKGILANQFRYSMALFFIDVYDELLPYELPGAPGRSYYRNAGRSYHSGIELGLNGYLTTGLTVAFSYTFSRFYFVNYRLTDQNFQNNKLPGIPKHMWYAELFYLHSSGFYSRLEIQGRSNMYVNDANTAIDRAYSKVNIQAGYRIRFDLWYIEPYFGLNNLFDVAYSDNVRINAFGDRYYEPAPEFNLYLGLSIHIGE